MTDSGEGQESMAIPQGRQYPTLGEIESKGKAR